MNFNLRRCFIKWCLASIEWHQGSVLGRTETRGSLAPTFLVPDFRTIQYGLVRSTAFHFFDIQ